MRHTGPATASTPAGSSRSKPASVRTAERVRTASGMPPASTMVTTGSPRRAARPAKGRQSAGATDRPGNRGPFGAGSETGTAASPGRVHTFGVPDRSPSGHQTIRSGVTST
ncbi:hypothetical protein GCM10027612_19530 [Microbispora bryophytorum subsp. camponoti]